MESINKNEISIDIPNYSGPLEVLLDLAKNTKSRLSRNFNNPISWSILRL